MVLKQTAISYVLFSPLSSGIALIFWSDGPALCQFGHISSSSYMKCMENKATEIFHVFILSFNKFIQFPSFLGSSWTYLDFFFLSLLAALETVQFFFSLSFFWSIFYGQTSPTMYEWQNTPISIVLFQIWLVPGVAITLKLCEVICNH